MMLILAITGRGFAGTCKESQPTTYLSCRTNLQPISIKVAS